MPIMISIMFCLIVGVLIINVIKGVEQWKKNNESPVLDVEAKVVAKRTHVTTHNQPINNGNITTYHTSQSSTYYVTFEFESGDRVEFKVPTSEYGMLVEDDFGKLKFQGTRYLEFHRQK